jgi:hypothetical protein
MCGGSMAPAATHRKNLGKIFPASARSDAVSRATRETVGRSNSLHEKGEQPGQHGAGDQRRPVPGIESEETTVDRNAHPHGTLFLFAGSCFLRLI